MQRTIAGFAVVTLTWGTAALVAQTPKAAPAPASTTDRATSYYHYGLAHIYEDLATSQGRSDYATQAVEEYKLALAADPDSSSLQNGLAELYFKVGRIREAVEAAQEQIRKDPDNVGAHTLLGRIYFRSLGEMQNGTQSQMVQLATQEYEELVRLQPDKAENHLLLGQLYELQHDSLKAEEQFKKARSIDPDSEEALLNMARLYSEQGDLNRVVATITALPETDRSSRLEFALGATYDLLKKPKEAAAAYQRSLDNDGDNTDAKRGLAGALRADGQLDKALVQYQQLVAAEPQDAQSYIRIAEIQRLQGHYEDALATLKKAKELLPESQELVYNEALTYDALGRYDDATHELTQMLARGEKADDSYNDPERGNRAIFLDRLGIIYREQNKTDLAVETYQKLGALGPDYLPRGYQGQIDAYRDVHQMDKATAVAAEAAKALPKNRDIQQAYADQLADAGKGDEAVALTKSLLNGSPDDRVTYLSLALMNTRLRRWQAADEALNKAESMSIKPEDKVFVYFQRGTLADRQKNYEAAEVQFRKVLAADPNNVSAMNYLGYMWADHDMKLAESVELLKKAVELDPQNGSYLDSLGWAYFKLGQYTQAEDYLLKAVNRMPGEAAIHDHLGEVYEKTGRLKMAVAQWERSLAEYAHTPAGDLDAEEVARVHHKLDTARVRLAKVRDVHGTP